MTFGAKKPDLRGDEALLKLREEYHQGVLDMFEADVEAREVRPTLEIVGHTSNFLDNLRLPVHRWFRYSAGFSAEWVKWLLAERRGAELHVLDPFVGSGTTCLACDAMGVESWGLEAHPFVYRVARAKLSYTADAGRFLAKAAGFDSWTFEKLRDRNVRWKNRKHRVPLCEGHLWVRG